MRILIALLLVLPWLPAPAHGSGPNAEENAELGRLSCKLADVAAVLEILIPDIRLELDDDQLADPDADLVLSWPIHYPFYADDARHVLLSPFVEAAVTGGGDRRLLGGVGVSLFPELFDKYTGIRLEAAGVFGDDGAGLVIGLAVVVAFDEDNNKRGRVTMAPAVVRRSILADRSDRSDAMLFDFEIPFTKCYSSSGEEISAW